MSASLSVDGVSFAPLGRPVALVDLNPTHLGPYAMQGATGATETTARFEWFRFTPTAEELAACQETPGGGNGGSGGDGGTGGGDKLPNTGAPALTLVLAAVVLLAAGATIRVTVARRPAGRSR